MAAPQELEDLTAAPAERFDLVVDFSGYPAGTEVTLRNDLGDDAAAQVMRFVVGDSGERPEPLPETLSDVERLDEAEIAGERVFRFELTNESGHGQMWTINGDPYDAAASIATVGLDTIEKWNFTSDFHHPVHVHLGHFQVLSRDGREPAITDAGWKDTVDLAPYETVEVLIRFTGHTGRYMMHCHNLEHEDMAMMANFDVE